MIAELHTLKQLRLKRQWTWEQLAAEMNRVIDPPISPRTLHYLLTYALDRGKPRETTLYKIQQFLEADKRRRKERLRSMRRRRAAADAVAIAP